MDIIQSYEFLEGDDFYCYCQDCAKLNSLERRKFTLSEDAEESEKRMQYLNEFSKEIASARKNVDDLEQRIRQARLDIEEFGKKKLSDLVN